MKSLTLLGAASLLASAHAWKFTYRNADGEANTVSGKGPHACIEVDNEKGQLFEMDGEGEKNINMLLFTTPDCSGKAAGMATETFSKKSSVTIRGFKVVSTAEGNGGGSGDSDSSAAHTATASSAGNGTATSGPSSTGKTVTLSDATTSTASASKTATTAATAATTAANASGASGTAASTSPSATASGDSGAAALAGSPVKVLGGVVVGLVTFGWLL